MVLEILKENFSICKISEPVSLRPCGGFYFTAKTDREYSLVCETKCAPKNTLQREDGWRAFRVKGTLDFSLTGVLSKISAALANCGIGIFAISTFDTDYIFVKDEKLQESISALEENGYIAETLV